MTTPAATQTEVANPYENFEIFLTEFSKETEKVDITDFDSFDTMQLITIFGYIRENFIQVKFPIGRPQLDLNLACPEYYDYLKENQKLLDTERAALIRDTEAVRVAAGLDDTTFLTHMKLIAEMEAEDEQC